MSRRGSTLSQQVYTRAGVNPDDLEVRRCCTDKRVKVRNWKMARSIAIEMSKKHGQRLRPYRCPLCGFFHLTSNKPRDFRSVVSEIPPGSHNGRSGRLWQPVVETVDVFGIELFVDQVLAQIGLSTVEFSLEVG